MATYFATDGSYGDGAEMIVLSTETWTPEMWEVIEEATDEMRIVVAHRLAHGYSPEEAGK